jgi:hypothetical protein
MIICLKKFVKIRQTSAFTTCLEHTLELLFVKAYSMLYKNEPQGVTCIKNTKHAIKLFYLTDFKNLVKLTILTWSVFYKS